MTAEVISKEGLQSLTESQASNETVGHNVYKKQSGDGIAHWSINTRVGHEQDLSLGWNLKDGGPLWE